MALKDSAIHSYKKKGNIAAAVHIDPNNHKVI